MPKELPPFSIKLKELRQAAGLSQAQLAEMAGLHPMALAKLEQGQRGPAWDTVLAIAKALNVTCEAFNQAPAGDAPTPQRGRPPKAPAPEPKQARKPRQK
jgi:transcriptional regulator with XRE-family HTH domain